MRKKHLKRPPQKQRHYQVVLKKIDIAIAQESSQPNVTYIGLETDDEAFYDKPVIPNETICIGETL